MRGWVILGVLGLAVGCGAEVKQVALPGGGRGLSITCEEHTECYREASKRCPGGYDLRDKGQEVWAGYGYAGTITTMLVQCR